MRMTKLLSSSQLVLVTENLEIIADCDHFTNTPSGKSGLKTLVLLLTKFTHDRYRDIGFGPQNDETVDFSLFTLCTNKSPAFQNHAKFR